MISTSEIVILVFFILILVISVWWFLVAYRYGRTLKIFSYTRGANVDLGDKTSKKIDLNCGEDREICVWRSTAICTGQSETNHEIAAIDPISAGSSKDSKEYGAYNPSSTIDLSGEMASVLNGKPSGSYTFDSSKLNWPSGFTCDTSKGVRPQLVSTYTCIPKGQKCTTYGVTSS